MHIKKLEIDNFKSFANKTEIIFLPGFTAVGGVNGSGKSNIIDSILFVLGLSNVRTLRTEAGLSDLITTHNQRNEASVKVTFDLDDGKGSEISFTRKIKKGSQGYTSSCYMDDSPCTLTQIHSELEKYNVTRNGCNVIMQGDVVSLVKCSSKERREFIDEVAGTADFDRKIDAATKELEGVELRVKDSLLILGEVESRCEQLKEEKEAAIKYRELKTEKDALEDKISIVKYFDFKRILEMVHQNILDAGKNQKEKEKEADTLDELIQKQQEEYAKIVAKLKAEGEDKQLEAKRKAEEKKGEIQLKKNSIAHTEKIFYDNNRTIEGSKRSIEEFFKKKEEIIQAIEEKKENREKFVTILAVQKEQCAKILEEVTGLNKTADTYIEKRTVLRKELDDLKEQEAALNREKLEFESKLAILNSELKTAKEAKENLLKEKESFNENKDKLELLIEKLNKEKEEATMLQKLTFDSLEKNKTELADLMRNIQLINNKRVELNANKNAYKRFGLGEGVETIMRYGLKGVHAPLSQLADVDVEYREAISEALGARSRYVVVENEHVGSQAIEILKSQGRDRATFLPLNKLKPAPTRLPMPKGEGVIDFAINLIDFDDIYIDAFYFALGETLIMQDMTSAKKLMGRYRMVTLDGEIFEKSGAMTGGAKRRNTAAFGKADDKELEKCEEKLKEFAEKNQQLDAKRIEYEKRLERCKQDFLAASSSLSGAKVELNVLIQNNQKSEDSIKLQIQKIEETEPVIKTITSKLDKLEEKDIALSEKITSVSDEITEVEKYIDESALNKLKEKTKDIEEEIRKTEKQIENIDYEVSKDENSITLNNTIIEQKKADIEKLKEYNIGLTKDKEKFTNDITTLEAELKELEIEIEELGKVFSEMQTAREKIQAEQTKTKNDRLVIQNEIDKIKEQIESSKERRNVIEPQFKEISDELKAKGVDINSKQAETMTTEEITSKIQKLQKKMDEMGDVNMKAITTYEELSTRQAELKEKVDTLEKEKSEIQDRMQGYEDLKKETFLKTYNQVSVYFSEIFTELTDGTGRLVLENPENPFMGGLTIEGQVKDKKKQKLAGMSGGEQTLMALSLVFAVQRHKPSPFYALDEVDAALDGFNVERIANKIANQPKDVQFIVISQRSQMHDGADQMIGVTLNAKGVTQVTGKILKKQEELIAG